MATTQKLIEKLNKNQTNQIKSFMGMNPQDIQSFLEIYKPTISQILPKHLRPEKIINIAINIITKSPKLAMCSVESIIGGIITSSILGLELNTPLQLAYLIPYKDKNNNLYAEFMLGYKGMMELAYRNQRVKTIFTADVREGDEFYYEIGLNPTIKHVPNINERGNIRLVYAVATLNNGGTVFEILNKDQIEKIRAKSKAKNSPESPWNNGNIEDYAKMARKSALRSLFNSGAIPYSVEMKYIEADQKTITLSNFSQDQSGEIYVPFESDEDIQEKEQKQEIQNKTEVKNEDKKKNEVENKVENKEPEKKPEKPPQVVENNISNNSDEESDFVKDVNRILVKQIYDISKTSKAASLVLKNRMVLYGYEKVSEMEELSNEELTKLMEDMKIASGQLT